MTNKEMCSECGEQEVVFHGLCEDCRDTFLNNNMLGHRGGDDGYDWDEAACEECGGVGQNATDTNIHICECNK